MAGAAGSETTAPVMLLGAEPKKSGYLYVVFDEKGGWDAAEILSHVSQNEGTKTVTPDSLPGAGKESDPTRCGSNTSLSVAIAGGPMQTIELCKALRKKIEEAKALAAKPTPGVPSAEECDAAHNGVTSILQNIFFGTQRSAHEGGACTLQYQDFDRLAHWLYVFSFDPNDKARTGAGDSLSERGSRYRSTDEVASQAAMAGYKKGDQLEALASPAELDAKVEALGAGESLMVGYKVHFINFFRNSADGKIYCYDGWGAKTVFAKSSPEYQAEIAKVFADGSKPRAFNGTAPKYDSSMWQDPPFAPGGLELSH